MRTFLQNKLWRDKVVKKIQEQGSVLEMRQLDDNEFDQQLRRKLLEECQEVDTAHSKKELIEELADVLEVVDALCALHEVSRAAVQEVQRTKRNDKGGFDQRLFIIKASHKSDTKSVEYCLQQPHKYPEITEN